MKRICNDLNIILCRPKYSNIAPSYFILRISAIQTHVMRIAKLISLLSIIAISACNPVTVEYPLIYTDEKPNHEFAIKLKEVLEESYNVDIRLVKASSVKAVTDSLQGGVIDMGLVENLSDKGAGINSVVPIYPKVFHLFYRENLNPVDIKDLFYDRSLYIGIEGSASYNFIMNLFDFYDLDESRIQVSSEMSNSDVMAIFSVIMNEEELRAFEGYKLFSLDQVSNLNQGTQAEGISLKFPLVKPFIIPKSTYGEFTNEPILTISTDMMFVVREGMGSSAVTDLVRSLFQHREQFVHVNPSFYFGIVEDFDRSKLSYPLHDGARAFLERDEPGFFERYAELAGVGLTIFLALGSGIISLTKWRKQKKKDKVDVFYEHLLKIKNEIPAIFTVQHARESIQEVKLEQNRAFTMLINEELEANDSFRIYMELSKETIDEIRNRYRLIKTKG